MERRLPVLVHPSRHGSTDVCRSERHDAECFQAVDRSELLTVPEAAERLRVSKWMLYNLIRSRKLRTVKIGSRRLVRVSAIAEYVASLEDEAA